MITKWGNLMRDTYNVPFVLNPSRITKRSSVIRQRDHGRFLAHMAEKYRVAFINGFLRWAWPTTDIQHHHYAERSVRIQLRTVSIRIRYNWEVVVLRVQFLVPGKVSSKSESKTRP